MFLVNTHFHVVNVLAIPSDYDQPVAVAKAMSASTGPSSRIHWRLVCSADDAYRTVRARIPSWGRWAKLGPGDQELLTAIAMQLDIAQRDVLQL